MAKRDTARAMSQENVELTYRLVDAVNRRDIDAVLALTDPEVEFIPRILEVEGGGSYRGHDGVLDRWLPANGRTGTPFPSQLPESTAGPSITLPLAGDYSLMA